VRQQIGDIDRAIADFQRAIELDAGSSVAFMSRARAYIVKHELDRAVADAAEAVDSTIDGPAHPDRLLAARDALATAHSLVKRSGGHSTRSH
jgi:hypothetical protein